MIREDCFTCKTNIPDKYQISEPIPMIAYEKRGTSKIHNEDSHVHLMKNKAGYTTTEVVCGWAGAIFEVIRPFGQEQ